MAFWKTQTQRIALFWLLQIGGWTGYALMNFLQGLIHEKQLIYILPSLVYAISGFILTLFLRHFYRWIWNRPPAQILVLAAIASLLIGVIFEASRVLAYINLYPSDWNLQAWWHAFQEFTLSWYVMLTWSGLYFGIKYYRKVQQQRQQLLEATSMAHEAQLKMLRYQLNPHFLFNTLNAISTLILAGEMTIANKMVTRLSRFLRHTLEMEPMQKLPLKHELEALQQYLAIEQLRLGDRLKIEWQIDDAALPALVPGMLLQPLIENAIKYAIAPREAGGEVVISATVTGDQQLQLCIADDGPGIDSTAESSQPQPGFGVGLTNTRNRLRVLYGDRQSYQVCNREPHGLQVCMNIPYER